MSDFDPKAFIAKGEAAENSEGAPDTAAFDPKAFIAKGEAAEKSVPAKPTISDDDKYSDEEYDYMKEAGKKRLTPAERREVAMMKDSDKRSEASKLWGAVKGVAETVGSMASGLYHTVNGGLGALAAPTDKGFDEAMRQGAEYVEDEQKETYQPNSEEGKALTKTLGTVAALPGQVAGSGARKVVGALGGSANAQNAAESIGEAGTNMVLSVAGPLKGLAKSGVRDAALAAEKASIDPALNTRGAKLLVKHLDGVSAEDLQAAKAELDNATAQGVNLTGPEAVKFAPKLHQLLNKVDEANGVVARFVKDRPEQAKAAIQAKLNEVGKDVGLQEAVNQGQQAATDVITQAQKTRTEKTSPYYQAQKSSDKQALKLMDEIPALQNKINAGNAWKNDAVQQAGRWYQFSHEMGLKANDVAKTVREWADEDAQAPLKPTRDFEAEGGALDPNKAKVDNYMVRADEGKGATYDAVGAAKERQGYIDQWQKELYNKSDALAKKNLPFVQAKVQGFINELGQQIQLAHPDTTEGKILADMKNELAPHGEPLMLPSQLESVYKANRDKLQLSMNPEAIERTRAGVLKAPIGKLDGLIKEVSPSIRQGRETYAEISNKFVDPLLKSPVGDWAGRGAVDTAEAGRGRIMAELHSDITTPERIRFLANKLQTVDKQAFPNVVRSYLEDSFNKAAKVGAATDGRQVGAKFVEAVAGTPKQKANVATMIEKSAEAAGKTRPEARAAAKGFSDMVEALEATGRVPRLGSRGVSDAMPALERGALAAGHLGAYGATKALATVVQDLWNAGAYKNLAYVFTNPNSIDLMQQLARMPKVKAMERQNLMLSIFDTAKMTPVPAAVAQGQVQQPVKEAQ